MSPTFAPFPPFARPVPAPIIPDAWPVPIHCAQPWFINLADLIAREKVTNPLSKLP